MNKKPWDIPNERWTTKTLGKCVRWWANELSLRDWSFNVRFASHRDLDGHLARCNPKLHFLDADISLLDYKDRDKDSPIEMDMEQDVVHELMHIRMWATEEALNYSENRHLYLLNEQSIDAVSLALVKMRRGDE